MVTTNTQISGIQQHYLISFASALVFVTFWLNCGQIAKEHLVLAPCNHQWFMKNCWQPTLKTSQFVLLRTNALPLARVHITKPQDQCLGAFGRSLRPEYSSLGIFPGHLKLFLSTIP